MKILSFLSKKKKYVLVISWWGTRGFYGLGILKWLEEMGIKDRIKVIYGVSAGAMLASYRAAGYSTDEIFNIFIDAKKFLNIYAINIFSRKSLLKSDGILQQFQKDLPTDISKLSPKVCIGTTNANTGKYKIFSQWDLHKILLWSISIPGIFPAIPYEECLLMDGGTTNNFPVDVVKKKYPKDEIIGIALNKFQENQKIENVLDNLSVAFEILLRNNTIENLPLVDHLFYNSIPIKILDTDKKKMKKAYDQGYRECMKHFKK